MRRFTSRLVMLALVLPVPALAQTLKPADLVGTWVIPHDGKEWFDSLQGKLLVDVLTLNADGSYVREMKKKEGDSLVAAWQKTGQEDKGPFRWSLAGDTLRLDEKRPWDSHKVVLQDGRLLWWNWLMWDANRRDPKCAEFAFERFDASKPLAVPPPPPITIREADLVGTWVGTFDTKYKNYGVVTDTLVIGADHTLRGVHLGPVDNANRKGIWALLSGDELTGPLGNIDRVRVYLQNGELVRCHYNYAVLKRVAP